MDLNFQGKPLVELDYEETVEFEKEINKRLLAADRAGMSDQVISQLQNYLGHVKLYQKEALERMRMGLDGIVESEDPEDAYSLIIGEPEPEDEDESE